MIGEASFHCGSHPDRLMHSAEVVVHVVQREGRRMVVDLLGKGIRQARKTTIAHANRHVLTFDVGRADVCRMTDYAAALRTPSPGPP